MRPAAALAGLLLATTLSGCVSPGPAGTPEPAAWAGLVAEAPGIVTAKANPEVETDVAVDPLDPDHLAVFHIERTRPYLTGNGALEPRTPGLIAEAVAVSHDGGATWGEDRRLPQAGTAAPGSAWGAFCSLADPNAFFDTDGVLHIVTLAVSCSAPGYLVATHQAVVHATTRDDGATWSEPDIVGVSAGGALVWINDREWTAYDPATGAILAVWSAFYATIGGSALTAAASRDGGRTWTLAEQVATDARGQNWLVHANALPDGQWRITGFGCPDANFAGRCLWAYTGAPGEGWERSEASLEDCGAPEGTVDYAVGAVDAASGRQFAAGGVLGGFLGAPIGTCVFASEDGGATWPVSRFFPGHDHPWIAVAPDGRLALASLQMDGDVATPAIALLDGASLDTTAWALLGEAYDMDPEDDGVWERAHYDVMAVAGDRFVWALTRPNAEGRSFDGSTMDMDVWAYRARLG